MTRHQLGALEATLVACAGLLLAGFVNPWWWLLVAAALFRRWDLAPYLRRGP